MHQLFSGSVAELLGVALYAGIAGVLTLLGAFFERASLHDLATGQSALGLWELAFGAILLYGAYSVVVHILLPQLKGSPSPA